MWTFTMKSLGIYFVGIDVFSERFVDGLIETSEQLGQGFASAADQHSQAIISVGGGGDATDRAEYAEGDFAIAD
jgi:hypothetical protein